MLVSHLVKENGEMAKSGGKTTSPAAAKAASKVLRDDRTSAASKTAAGSALSQVKSKGKGKSEPTSRDRKATSPPPLLGAG